jgi:hypothetical protein
MQTLHDIAPYVALAAAAVSLALLIVVIVLLVRVGRLRRAQTLILGHHEERDIVAHVGSLDSQVRNLRQAVEILTDQLDEQKRRLDHALTNRAIVRYDAFRDAGGEQSASFALLDGYRSGVVFSAIAARDFARIYVKHLQDGVADRDLSPEEEQVIAAAVPRPLHADEEGPRAARAPMPDDAAKPRDPGAAGAAPDGGGTPAAGGDRESEEGAAQAGTQTAAAADAAAAFESFGEAAGTGGEPAADPAPADSAEFTWESPPVRPPQNGGGAGA